MKRATLGQEAVDMMNETLFGMFGTKNVPDTTRALAEAGVRLQTFWEDDGVGGGFGQELVFRFSKAATGRRFDAVARGPLGTTGPQREGEWLVREPGYDGTSICLAGLWDGQTAAQRFEANMRWSFNKLSRPPGRLATWLKNLSFHRKKPQALQPPGESWAAARVPAPVAALQDGILIKRPFVLKQRV